MEGVIPPLKLISCVRKALEKGASPRQGLIDYLRSEPHPWQEDVTKWWARQQQGTSSFDGFSEPPSATCRQLLHLLERGLKGESIYQNLCDLEAEIFSILDLQTQAIMGRLPYLMLVPLALFLFPACAILMLGPFILQLVTTL